MPKASHTAIDGRTQEKSKDMSEQEKKATAGARGGRAGAKGLRQRYCNYSDRSIIRVKQLKTKGVDMEQYGKCECLAILPDIIALNKVDAALRVAASAAWVCEQMEVVL